MRSEATTLATCGEQAGNAPERAAALIARLRTGWHPSLDCAVTAALSPSFASESQIELSSVYLQSIQNASECQWSADTCSALLQVSRTFYGACDFSSGSLAAEIGTRQAASQKLHQHLCALLKVHAAHLMEMNQLARSIETTSRAIVLAEEKGLLNNLGSLYNNLGTACMYAFAYADALESLRRAEAAGLLGLPRYNMAWIHLQQGDVEDALAAIDVARRHTVFAQPGAELVRAVALTIETSALAAAGRLEEATVTADSAAELACINPLFARQARLARGIAECAKDLDEGRQLLEEFYWDVKKDQGSVGLARMALSELVAAHERAARPEEALRYLHLTLELNKGAHRAQLVVAQRFGAADLSAELDLETRKAYLERDILQTQENLEDLAVRAGLMSGYDECHIYRRGRLARMVGEALGLSKVECEELTLAGRLADVGLAAVPDRVLRKPGLLNEGERKLLSEHTVFGAELVGSTRLVRLHTARRAALSHHERWDGTGGPSRLRGNTIPLEGRIVALCDAFEALTQARPWRAALPANAALLEIESQAGRVFDPELTRVFATATRTAFWTTADWDAYLAEEARSSPFVKTLQLMKRRKNGVNFKRLY
jgi:HD-GYP domain-containing protein (c-di-GMP phosphodiesterase class II)